VPTYLKTERGLSVVGTGGCLTFLIPGAFIGYLTGGHLTDRLGRHRNIWLFALLSAVCILAYANVPSGADALLLVLGFPLGFCMSAVFSGFGSYLSELYPAVVRGTGQGFTYNTGRAVGAVFPTTVGFLADSWGVGGALGGPRRSRRGRGKDSVTTTTRIRLLPPRWTWPRRCGSFRPGNVP
jgi:MFS family permease